MAGESMDMKSKQPYLLVAFFVLFSWLIYQQLQTLSLSSFIFSDSLYLATMDTFGWANYSSPINVNFFPDYLFYQASSVLSADPFVRVIYTGLIQFACIALAVTLMTKPYAAALYLSIYVFTALDFAVSLSSHTLLILQVIMTLYIPARFRFLAVMAFSLSDPMFLLIASAYLVARSLVQKNSQYKQHVFLMAVWALCFVYGELNNYFNKVILMLIAGALASWFVQLAYAKFKISVTLTFSVEKVCGFLLIATAVALALMEYPQWPIAPIRERYIIAILGSGMVLLFQESAITLSKLVLSLVCTVIFSVSLFLSAPAMVSKIDTEFARFDCLAKALIARGIDTVAVDYWVSKPLFLRSPEPLKLMQFEFFKAEPFLWGSPYAWAHGDVKYFIQRVGCTQESERTHCTKEWLNTVAKPQALLCESFELYETQQVQSFERITRKSDAIQLNFKRKVTDKLGL